MEGKDVVHQSIHASAFTWSPLTSPIQEMIKGETVGVSGTMEKDDPCQALLSASCVDQSCIHRLLIRIEALKSYMNTPYK